MVEISRSKDGVPQWSGDAASYQEYEEQALQWEQSVEYKKRYLCGPKLIQEMSGTARKLVTGKRPDWLSFNDTRTLRVLEQVLQAEPKTEV